jgi:hypothetical protein
MNFLSLIQARQQKAARLHEAQYLLAKAYRGVEYSKVEGKPKGHPTCTYRGVSYVS